MAAIVPYFGSTLSTVTLTYADVSYGSDPAIGHVVNSHWPPPKPNERNDALRESLACHLPRLIALPLLRVPSRTGCTAGIDWLPIRGPRHRRQLYDEESTAPGRARLYVKRKAARP